MSLKSSGGRIGDDILGVDLVHQGNLFEHSRSIQAFKHSSNSSFKKEFGVGVTVPLNASLTTQKSAVFRFEL